MLAYVLAIVIAIGSFSFYMAAFFVPEIHRRQDFVWSGVGLFYAVVLWFCAGRITGAVLLGQIASVALLGWLGWQTLGLRRELTPETVRTPVSWEDLQRWSQAAQQGLVKYLQMSSLLAGAKAVWADIKTAIATMQNRIAGPKGEVRSPSDIPPLRRSPAYEFETETGQGESVPAEFATVPTAPPPQTASPVATPPTEAVTQVSESTPPASEPEAPTVSPILEVTLEQTPEMVSDTAASAQVETSATTAVTEPPPNTQDTTATSVPPKAIPSNTPKSSSTTPNRVVILRDWFGELLQGFRKPKPQRTVIEIPPREPSIPRSPDAAAKPQKPKTPSKRAVIDIPPRPPSIPRPPKPSQTDPPPKPDTPDTNWVDVGDDDQNWATQPSSSTPPAPQDQSSTATETLQDAPTEPETNWPDDDAETNWPED
ncbi:MAG: Ycf66 family protein [Cyanobacteria bacterium P01_F01_bin.86]